MSAEAVRSMRQGQIGDLPFEGIRAKNYVAPVHSSPSPFTYGFGVGILVRETPDEWMSVGSYGWDGIGTRRFWVVPSEELVIIIMIPAMGFSADPAQKEIEAAAVAWARSRGS
jgi:CubicO group peptidase (beta-lactamase class C family)